MYTSIFTPNYAAYARTPLPPRKKAPLCYEYSNFMPLDSLNYADMICEHNRRKPIPEAA